MRQRRLSYRYTMVVTSTLPSSLADVWRSGRPAMLLSRASWTPPTDVYETVRSVTVTVELAGAEEDQMQILLYDNALVIEGRRRLPPVEPDGVYRVAQVQQGPFRVEVALPMPINDERIETSYEKGLLRIVLPKLNGPR